MVRISVAVVPLAALLASSAPQEPRTIGSLAAAGTFFYPTYADDKDRVLAEIADEKITGELYGRYLAARFGTRYVEDLAFELALARECKKRRLARGAPTLARGVAAAQLRNSGRVAKDDPDASLQRRFANEALQEQRVNALIRAQWLADPEELRAVFDHRFGKDGVRVRVRHILVSFADTRRRMRIAGRSGSEFDIARERAESIHEDLQGTDFVDLLERSDDRATRRLLKMPNQRAEAGFLPDYNYRRYGNEFADAVRGLGVGEFSTPVRSNTGYHLIQVTKRTITKFENVEAAVRRELGARKPSQRERAQLRRALLRDNDFSIKQQ